MAVNTYSANGNKAATPAKLSKEVFAVEIKNHQLLKDAYVAQLANKRDNLATTLKRGEVRGGGAKPWRQKGTGRARVGSSRTPVWRGGGITFGPIGNENYSKKVNLKARRIALTQALTLANQDGKLIILESFTTKGKVKDTVTLLKKIGASRKTLIVVSVYDDLVQQATNNLPNVNAKYAKQLTVNDVLDSDTLVISKKSVTLLEDWLGGKK